MKPKKHVPGVDNPDPETNGVFAGEDVNLTFSGDDAKAVFGILENLAENGYITPMKFENENEKDGDKKDGDGDDKKKKKQESNNTQKADNSSPWKVGWEWLSGTGPRTHNFKGGDKFTELLKKHKHIEETRKKIARAIANGTLQLNKSYPNNYNLGGLAGVPKYFGDYSTLLTGGLTGNIAVTYLGSYVLSYKVIS
jgi:hypothetical protein